ncbi:MAG: 4-alpha-glucanotransferase, partial [Desulfobacterota bacterium]|nr:4-alpha-glucanotransferase [Thermodesulfobacteriota bacterium]
LGEEAYRFADLLMVGGQRYWQVLPLNPVSPAFGYSPYASPSAFAGNPLLINLDDLKRSKWFDLKIESQEEYDADFVDYDTIMHIKTELLLIAADCFFKNASEEEAKRFKTFCSREASWLDDYALFAACADHFGTNCWQAWEPAIAFRKKDALTKCNTAFCQRINFHKFTQYLFFTQWTLLKTYCNARSIRIIGDLPIYVPFDGADVWAHSDIFQLDPETRTLISVAGVPPDYFSSTGQLWGNPLYRWKNEEKKLHEGTYEWWVRRIRHLLKLVDVIRLDHFRGFEAYWAVPAGEATAIKGKWHKGPGRELFRRLRYDLGDIPFIAEDLGYITPPVTKLRRQLGLPGMKVLQFAFDRNNKNPYLPHTYTDRNCVVYTGTHDNNTTNGWFYGPEIDNETRRYVMEYIGTECFSDFHWHLIRLAYRSIADLVILPAQDVLGYGAEFRMNTPGTTSGNWKWKLKRGALTEELMLRLRHMAQLYDRIPSA